MRNLLRQFCVWRSSRLQLQDFTRSRTGRQHYSSEQITYSSIHSRGSAKLLGKISSNTSGEWLQTNLPNFDLLFVASKSGYWTKTLDEQSELLTVFNTPFKKYCFVRLPFGLSASSEIFCKEMDQVLSGVPGTFPYADDVKVQGSTKERHDIHLLETVERVCKAGLKFKPNKCCIKKLSALDVSLLHSA